MKLLKTITGYVKKGHGQGNKVGLKTANLNVKLAKKLVKGLYTCQVILYRQNYEGLLYYGYNSLTKTDCLEVHIRNFSGDIYGKKITVKINRYLRAPKKFASVKKLAKQIKKDLKSVTN